MIDIALAAVGVANLAAVAWLLTRTTEEDAAELARITADTTGDRT